MLVKISYIYFPRDCDFTGYVEEFLTPKRESSVPDTLILAPRIEICLGIISPWCTDIVVFKPSIVPQPRANNITIRVDEEGVRSFNMVS